MKTKNKKRFWTCVIGPADENDLSSFSDFPMRSVVENAFYDVTNSTAKICSSGWGNVTEEAAVEANKKTLVYAVKKTCGSTPELKELTIGELLKMLTDYAKEYSIDGVESIKRNSHMNELTKTDKVDKNIVDAVLVDFINHIASKHCVDYALYARDLNIEHINEKY